MNCTEAQAQLHRYLDAELDPETRRAVALHLQGCEACRAFHAEQLALAAVLAAHAPDFRASAPLRARIVSRLPDGTLARVPRLPAPGWWGAAAAAGLAVALTWGLDEQQRAADWQENFKDDAVAAHRRALQERHLVDIAAAGPAQLESWFRARLPYPVAVRDLSARGYALVGGRVDYLYEQAVAAVVYRRGDHLINVLVWPAAQSDRFPSVPLNEAPLTVLFLRRDGTNFCVISDLAPEQFGEFAQLLAQG